MKTVFRPWGAASALVPLLVLLPALAVLTGSFRPFGPATIERISANMVSRQVQAGKSVSLKGEIYYQRDGNMVTHFVYPKEYMIVANKFGETKIYDPEKNTVIQYQNFLFSTQSSQFYYFFTGRIADMGLGHAGFVQDKTYNEGHLLVTEWKLKMPNKKNGVQRVKVVYEGQLPVYMHYEDINRAVFRKVFYYNYQQLDVYSFPSTTTEILYEKGDSVVSKTNYTDFKLNAEATGAYFNFKVPPNAKTEQP
jgi:hypothetical protein